MKKHTRIFAVILFALLFSVSTVNVVFAITTSDAKEEIDTSKNCSLTLTYAIDEKKLEGLEIEIYQTATVTADFQYSMTGAFASYPIEINGIKSQSEWDELKDTVEAYITADRIAPTAVETTDAEGTVRFASLPVGIYYVGSGKTELAGQEQAFASFLISVPDLGEDGKWIYDVEALPKSGIKPQPKSGEMKIVKLWKDGSQSNERPDSIIVDIIKDGTLYQSISLTAQTDWIYTWETDGEYHWTAVERNVPDGYLVSVQNIEGTTIQITNTKASNPPAPPPTGDSSNLYFWIVLTALSGVVFVVLGVYRRKTDEE